MIIGAVFFYVVYLVMWRQNKELRNVTTRVVNKKLFEEYFDYPLDFHVKSGIVKFYYEKTKYFYFALLALFISVVLLCLKIVSHV